MLSRQITRALTPVVQTMQKRGNAVIAGPPQVKVSGAEKAVHAALMFTGWLTIPVWVLTHMREYKGQK